MRLDCSKALIKAIRRSFGLSTPIRRCRVHKASDIADQLTKHLHASVRAALRQGRELHDTEKAKRLIRILG